MNKWNLRLKSSELEQEFKMQDNKTNVKILNIITFVVLVMSTLQIGIIFLNGTYEIRIFLYFFLYFVAGLICIVVSCYRIRYFNFAVMFSLISYVGLITWSNRDEHLKKFFSVDTTITPFVRGFFLCINISTSLLGSSFVMKMMFLFFLFLCILLSASQDPAIDAIKLFPTILAFICKVYIDDQAKRNTFLLQKKDQIWDYLVDYMLPSSLILTKYNEATHRFELFSQNKKARDEFGIENTDQFYTFCKQIVLNSYSKHREMREELERCKEPEWENTLYGQIRIRFNREIQRREGPANFEEEKFPLLQTKSNGVSNKSNIKTFVEEQNILGKKREDSKESKGAATEGDTPQRQSKPSIPKHKNNWAFMQKSGNPSMDKSVFSFAGRSKKNSNSIFTQQPTDFQTLHKEGLSSLNQHKETDEAFDQQQEGVEQFQAHLIDDQYVPVPNKKFSVRLITFFLNDYFTVISIQRDEFREKYIHNIEENIKFNHVLDESFRTLNQLSVASFNIIKSLFISSLTPNNNQKTKVQPFQPFQSQAFPQSGPQIDSKIIHSLLYAGYSVKQHVFNTFEWMNKKKKTHTDCISKVNIHEILHGIVKIFEIQATRKQLKLVISAGNAVINQPVFTDERILNQILFNLVNFCIFHSALAENIVITCKNKAQNQNQLQFSLTFKSQNALNLSYLNCSEVNDEHEVNYSDYIEIKISKHILKFINPSGNIYFSKISQYGYEISFTINTSKTQQRTCLHHQVSIVEEKQMQNSDDTLFSRSNSLDRKNKRNLTSSFSRQKEKEKEETKQAQSDSTHCLSLFFLKNQKLFDGQQQQYLPSCSPLHKVCQSNEEGTEDIQGKNFLLNENSQLFENDEGFDRNQKPIFGPSQNTAQFDSNLLKMDSQFRSPHPDYRLPSKIGDYLSHSETENVKVDSILRNASIEPEQINLSDIRPMTISKDDMQYKLSFDKGGSFLNKDTLYNENCSESKREMFLKEVSETKGIINLADINREQKDTQREEAALQRDIVSTPSSRDFNPQFNSIMALNSKEALKPHLFLQKECFQNTFLPKQLLSDSDIEYEDLPELDK